MAARDIPDHKPGDGFEAPKVWWTPSISPGALMIYTGDKFPQWKGDALVGALSGEALIRVDIDGDKARKADQWPMGARIRAVDQGPDGSVYLLRRNSGGGCSGSTRQPPASNHQSPAAGCGGDRASPSPSRPGYFSLAASSLTDGEMMQSSPCFQLTGVATRLLGGQLDRIEQAQHLVEVAARAHRIEQHRPDHLVRADDVDGAHGRVVGGGAARGRCRRRRPGACCRAWRH